MDHADTVRRSGWSAFVEAIRQDTRFAFRLFRHHRLVTLVAVLTLALAIGADTAMFSVVNAIVLRPLPIREPDQIVTLHHRLPKLNLPSAGVSAVQFREYSAHADLFESSALLIGRNLNLATGDQPRRLRAMRATATLFPLLGVRPVLGRTFTPAEDEYGQGHVAVLSERLWKELYGGAGDAIGKTVRLDGEAAEVVGVAPAALETLYPDVDLWIPIAVPPRFFTEDERWTITFTMLARLRPGVTLARARAALEADASRVLASTPPEHAGKLAGFGVTATTLPSEYVGDVRRPLFLLLGAVVLVLTIACANVANLLIARGVERSHEIAMRVALGASRGRVSRQLLTESICLALVAGVVGVAIAWVGVRVLVSYAPATLPHAAGIRIDPVVLAFTAGVSLLAGVLFGLAPALQAGRVSLMRSIQGEGRSQVSGSRRREVRRALLLAEVAVTFVLVVVSGLLLRTVVNLFDADMGFRADQVLAMRLAPSNRAGGGDFTATAQALLARVAAVPGVQHAALASEPPLMGTNSAILLIRDYQSGPNAPQPHADVTMTSPDYFATLGIPLLQGRTYTDADMASRNPVTVVDQAFARRFWPGQDPIGRQIARNSRSGWVTVIGVVGTVRTQTVRDTPEGLVYFPMYAPGMSLVVRSGGSPADAALAVREQIRSIDPGQAVYDVRTMPARISQSIGQQAFVAAVLAAFAILALVFAASGVYSVTANIVTLRTREIGVRMALGARRADVLRLVFGQELLTAFAGLALGAVAAFAISGFVASLLFNVAAADPVTFAGAAALVSLVVFAACCVPALRATRVDSAAALRS